MWAENNWHKNRHDINNTIPAYISLLNDETDGIFFFKKSKFKIKTTLQMI